MGTWCSSHSFCCPSKMSHFSCGIGFIIFNFDLTRLPTWAVAWLFGWCQEIPLGILSLKGDAVWTPGTVCFFTSVCFCLCIKGSESVKQQSLFWLAGVCRIFVSVCECVCLEGKTGWVWERRHRAVRVLCTVITLSGMWVSWELLTLGTCTNKLLFKGQLPSLCHLWFLPFMLSTSC